MADNVWKNRVCTEKTFVSKTMQNGKQYGQARKTTPDSVYCTGMTKALQQSQTAAAFVKCMGIL